MEDVENTISMVSPDIIMLELCRARTGILTLDEKTIIDESTNLDFNKMKLILRNHGTLQGSFYLLLLSVSSHITKQLGMAPGGEFRAAIAAQKE